MFPDGASGDRCWGNPACGTRRCPP